MKEKVQRSWNSTLRPRSKKAEKETAGWVALGDARLEKQVEHRGYTYCEDCKGYGERDTDNPWRRLDYHHKDGDRRNNTDENLKVVHREPCHRRYKEPDKEE